MSLIRQLTAEQEVMIPVYLEKWRRIALSTQPINRQRAQAAVNSAYAAIGRRSPEVFFVSGPNELKDTLDSNRSWTCCSNQARRCSRTRC
ncbi:MAG: hypothetical protein MJA27_30470 [Pseudanabaenales cyanobacterium]|nr:hypothetical protein [Pseudanabaenales cyanobacterium]